MKERPFLSEERYGVEDGRVIYSAIVFGFDFGRIASFFNRGLHKFIIIGLGCSDCWRLKIEGTELKMEEVCAKLAHANPARKDVKLL